MTDPTPTDQQYGVRLEATFLAENEVRTLPLVAVGSAIPSSAAVIIWPVAGEDRDGDPELVLELLTSVPRDELADLLEMVVEGLRNGAVTSVAVDAPRPSTVSLQPVELGVHGGGDE